jgi:sporulation protein YlmC with PRC-barrel domain
VADIRREDLMKKTALALALGVATLLPVASMTPALAAADTLSSVPAGKTIQDYYKQSVYDQANNKIGSIDDVVVSESGQITAFMVGTGGVLGAGGKDVALPFSAVHAEMKNGEWYLTVAITKEQLQSAPGFTQDKDKWVPAKNG